MQRRLFATLGLAAFLPGASRVSARDTDDHKTACRIEVTGLAKHKLEVVLTLADQKAQKFTIETTDDGMLTVRTDSSALKSRSITFVSPPDMISVRGKGKLEIDRSKSEAPDKK